MELILARNPALLTALNRDDREPIHEACIRGEVPVMELLVSRGADINARSKAENTTLHWAVHAFVGPEVRGEMVAFLLTLNPDLATARNVNGLTPLHWAGNELPETIQLLLDSGAAAWSRGLRRMKESAPEIDLAFVPVFVAGDDETSALSGFMEVTGWIHPNAVFPAGGSGAQMYLYREAADLAEGRWPEMMAKAPANRGDLLRVTIIT